MHVYLSKDLKASEFVDLGPIKGTEGNINYEVPENIAKNRWAIAIVCAIIFLFIGVAIQHSSNQPTQAGGHVIYAILAFTVAGALKNPDKPKANE